MPRLSIIIVTYNSRGEIDECLRSLTDGIDPAIPLGARRDIVVVDNASTDGTAAHIRERWSGHPTDRGGGEFGFARATNIGIRQTSGELVLLLNPDTSVPPGAIDGLVVRPGTDPRAAAVGPRSSTARAGGAVVRPHDFAAGGAAAEDAGHGAATGSAPGVERMTRRRATSTGSAARACSPPVRTLEAAGLLDERSSCTRRTSICARPCPRAAEHPLYADVEIVHLRGRRRPPSRRAREAAYRRSQLAFYENTTPAWVPALRVYLALFAPPGR